MQQPNDELLIERARRGDQNAFEQLITQHEKMLYNVALRIMKKPEDAMDMAQESIIKIYRYISGFKGDCTFSVWMYRIVTNTCLDELRRRKRKASVSLDSLVDEGTMQFEDKGETPEQKLERHELSDMIREAINELDDDYRVVITLRDIQELSYQEIAEVTSSNIGTVKSRIFRARSQLQKKLAPYIKSR